jgi:glycosyltransferase involved in cell wall biosynthesis
MSRRRLLFYTHALAGGGAERVWAVLASGFARRGDDVVLAVDFEAPENRPFLDPRVRLVVLGGNHFTSMLRLATLLSRERPDVSLSALAASNLKHFFAASMAGRLGRAILSYHGYWSSEPQLLSRIGYLATPIVTRLAAATVCVSDGLLRHIVKRWKASRKKSLRIYNPTLGKVVPALTEADLLARAPVVLACGRLVFYKNFPGLVRAFAAVEPAEARLVILGQGEEKAAIENEIRRLNLEHRVQLPGYVTEPWSTYEQARCFVLPSDSESFGLVLVEALAGGLAVVSTDCDGPCEILQDGRLGRLVPRRDETALARAITAALADPGAPAERIARARDFSLDIGLDAYESLITQIAARQASTQAGASPLAAQPSTDKK